jgi:hypothetical protein
MGKETRQMSAYKGTRAHYQEGNLEDKESKKSFVVRRQTKRGELPQGAKSLHMGGILLP